jgi:hypothetical protein
MKYVSGYLIGACLCLLTSMTVHGAEVTCECPKLGCDPCSYQQSLKFYTDKCGPDNSKVKSCARPTCIPIDQATAECPVPPKADSGPREPVVLKAVDTPKESGAEPEGPGGIGRVKVIQGSVSIVHIDGKKTVVSQEAELHEGETVQSGKDGAAVIGFDGGNKVHVHPDTTLEVKEYKDPKVEASRRALLNLIKGKIRNQVEQKYDGKSTYYRIHTKGAVAGVRGTDFVVEHSEDGKDLTEVKTLRGNVVLALEEGKESREIGRGEGATLAEGKLTPVFKLSDEQMKELDRSSRVDVAAVKSKKNRPICDKPTGFFNQCSWHCTNNPSGEKKCRVDLPNVACVRSRCNANGAWAEETRLPDPAGPIACPGNGFLVKDCDY